MPELASCSGQHREFPSRYRNSKVARLLERCLAVGRNRAASASTSSKHWRPPIAIRESPEGRVIHLAENMD